MSNTWTMTPRLRAQLIAAIEGERAAGWGDDADAVRAALDATPDGPIDAARFDALTRAQGERDLNDTELDELDAHVVTTITYFGFEREAAS